MNTSKHHTTASMQTTYSLNAEALNPKTLSP